MHFGEMLIRVIPRWQLQPFPQGWPIINSENTHKQKEKGPQAFDSRGQPLDVMDTLANTQQWLTITGYSVIRVSGFTLKKAMSLGIKATSYSHCKPKQHKREWHHFVWNTHRLHSTFHIDGRALVYPAEPAIPARRLTTLTVWILLSWTCWLIIFSPASSSPYVFPYWATTYLSPSLAVKGYNCERIRGSNRTTLLPWHH